MTEEGLAIYLGDLTGCEPAAALSPTPRQNCWQTVPYEAEGLSGTMLLADSQCSAPALELMNEPLCWRVHSSMGSPERLPVAF